MDDEPSDEDGFVIVPARLVFALKDGGYFLALPIQLREMVTDRIGEIRTSLMSDPDHPGLRPLFPPAYTDNPEFDEEYQRFMRSELVESRLAAFDTVEQTMRKDELTEDELYQWMQSVNAVRLALASIYDFNFEDQDVEPADPRYPEFQFVEFLTLLLSEIVSALRAGGTLNKPR